MTNGDQTADSGNEARQPESGRETLQDRAGRQAPLPADLAEHFPQLEVIELLGQGGMGYVYKARQPGLDRLVALKLLPQEISEDRNFAERFAREARALARLSHPSIVTVHDSGQVGGLYYFVMEFVDGLNLRDLLHRSEEGRVEPAEALRIVGAVCDALEYAHEEGVVHRDIKPENILLDKKGRVKIADFGLAKLLGGNGDTASRLTLAMPQQRMGTPHYMAPEQTERPLEVDHRADIYSVGVVFYEMLTGELPLGRFPLPSEMGRGDPELDEIVVRALEKNPQRRFQHASDIKTAVDSALSGAPDAPSPTALDDLLSTIDVEAAYRRVGPPATCLFITGIVSLVFLSPTGIILILAGIKMKRLQWRVFAIVASVVALLPLSAVFPISIPVGIWGLYILTRPEIAAAFDIVAAARMERATITRRGRDPRHREEPAGP